KTHQIDRVPRRPRLPRRIVRPRRHRVPGTHLLAHVAAVDVRPDRGLVLARDVAAKLNRQIRDAARRIEDAGRDDGARRTRVQTTGARSALVERWRIDRQRQAAEDRAEKYPRSERRVDDARILADPADAGMLGVDALLDRPGVDVRARVEWLGRS